MNETVSLVEGVMEGESDMATIGARMRGLIALILVLWGIALFWMVGQIAILPLVQGNAMWMLVAGILFIFLAGMIRPRRGHYTGTTRIMRMASLFFAIVGMAFIVIVGQGLLAQYVGGNVLFMLVAGGVLIFLGGWIRSGRV